MRSLRLVAVRRSRSLMLVSWFFHVWSATRAWCTRCVTSYAHTDTSQPRISGFAQAARLETPIRSWTAYRLTRSVRDRTRRGRVARSCDYEPRAVHHARARLCILRVPRDAVDVVCVCCALTASFWALQHHAAQAMTMPPPITRMPPPVRAHLLLWAITLGRRLGRPPHTRHPRYPHGPVWVYTRAASPSRVTVVRSWCAAVIPAMAEHIRARGASATSRIRSRSARTTAQPGAIGVPGALLIGCAHHIGHSSSTRVGECACSTCSGSAPAPSIACSAYIVPGCTRRGVNNPHHGDS